MKNLERILKALANKRRLAIIQYLKKRQPASVGDIAKNISLSFKVTSKHLGLLDAVDIVEKNKESLQVFYRLAENQNPVSKQTISLL
ncbi:MAG: metalloregulator ArsR/SmtB family transcription factor [Patescibacteria group bacterium]